MSLTIRFHDAYRGNLINGDFQSHK